MHARLEHTHACTHTPSRLRVHACVPAVSHTPMRTCPPNAHSRRQHAPQAARGGGSVYPEQMAVDRSTPAAAVVSGADLTSPQRMPFTRDALGKGPPGARRPRLHAPTTPPTRPLNPVGANTAARAAHKAMRTSGAGAPDPSAPLLLAATLPGTPGTPE